MRTQVGRQKRDIEALEEAGISTVDAEALLVRMKAKVATLCTERDRLTREAKPSYASGKRIYGTPSRMRG